MTSSAGTRRRTAIQIRADLLNQAERWERGSRERIAGVIEGAVLAYADLHGPRAATEICFQVAEAGCRVSLGAEWGRSMTVPEREPEVVERVIEKTRLPSNPVIALILGCAFVAGAFVQAVLSAAVGAVL